MSQDKMQDMGFNGSAYGENVYDDDDDTLRGLEFEKDDFSSETHSESTNSHDCMEWDEQCRHSADKHLRQGWCTMTDSLCYLQVSIFSSDSTVKERTELDSVKEKREALSVIVNAFGSWKDEPFASLSEPCKVVLKRNSYKIIEIVRVQNVQRADMHGSFMKNHNIPGQRVVFHGTSPVKVGLIAETGFRGSFTCQIWYGPLFIEFCLGSSRRGNMRRAG